MAPLLLTLLLIGAAGQGGHSSGRGGTGTALVQLYPSRNDPFSNPAQQRAWTKPPNLWASPKPHFAGYRGPLNGTLLDAYNATGLGDAVWPTWQVLATGSLDELRVQLQDFARRGLWLVDLWGYIPGDPDNCHRASTDPAAVTSGTCEYHLPRAVQELASETLGERFGGLDVGEQDGRYLDFAPMQYRGSGGAPGARRSELRQGFLRFMQHFDRMADDLGNRLMSIGSLWNSHYFARTGFYTALGAETAQALPNPQVSYSFIRGAAKQYGTWYWSCVSIYNRWGSKHCEMRNSTTVGEVCVCSEAGTSLSLMRRLMYQQLMYGVKVFAFESLGCASATSPIAKIHRAGQHFAATTDVGVHLTSTALVADVMTGFAPARSLYADGQGWEDSRFSTYRLWGNLPFDTGAFWMSNVLDLCYPGYIDSSYLSNEDGFNTPTPFGDSLDVLLSDVGLDVLARYPTVFVATPIISAVLETTLKLERYVKEGGGTLVVTIDALSSLPSLLGVTADMTDCTDLPAGQVVCMSARGCAQAATLNETRAIRHCRVASSVLLPIVTTYPATANSTTLVWSSGSAFQGVLLVLASSGMSATRVAGPNANSRVNGRLANPFPMADHARSLLTQLLGESAPFSTGAGALSLVVNRVDTANYLIGIANPGLEQAAFNLTSRIGDIQSIVEVPLLDATLGPNGTQGYPPGGYQHVDRGLSGNSTIAGLDQRIFKVTLQQETATLLPTMMPALNPHRIALPLPQSTDLTEDIMLRSTFGQHFDGIVLDWTYIERRSAEELRREGRWAFMRNVSILVDFTSGLNLYPGLRLCNNSDEYSRSIARMGAVLQKMSTLVNASQATIARMFSADAIVAEHRDAEDGRGRSGYGPGTEVTGRCRQDTHAALALLMTRFPTIRLHLQTGETQRFPESFAQAASAVQAMGAPQNLRLALHTGQLTWSNTSAASIVAAGAETPSMRPGVLFVGAPALDEWDSGAPSDSTGQPDSHVTEPWKCVRYSAKTNAWIHQCGMSIKCQQEGCLLNANHTWTAGDNQRYPGCTTCYCCEPTGAHDPPAPAPSPLSPGYLNCHAPLPQYPLSQRAALQALLRIGREARGPLAGETPWLVLDASLPNQFEGLNAAEDSEFAEVTLLELLLKQT